MPTIKYRSSPESDWTTITPGATSFNNRFGNIMPQSGDYTAEMVGARPDDWVPTAEQVGSYTKEETNAKVDVLGHRFTIYSEAPNMNTTDTFSAGIVYPSAENVPSGFTSGYGLLESTGFSSAYTLQKIHAANNKIYERMTANGTPTDWVELLTSGSFGSYAAPAGYGYGKYEHINIPSGMNFGTAIDELTASWPDRTIKQYSIWYQDFVNQYSFVATIAKFTSNLILVNGCYYDGYAVTAKKTDGTWRPLEWVNPPMRLGVEYRTTERFNGEPVFVTATATGITKKLVDGTLIPSVNKPSGSYAGNGDATSRTINVGGTGKVLFLQSLYSPGFAFVTPYGAIVTGYSDIRKLTSSECQFLYGDLKLNTNDTTVNPANTKVEYWVL